MGLCQREGAVMLLVKVKPVEMLGGNTEEFSHSCSAFVFHQDVDRSVEMLGFCAEERAAWRAVPAEPWERHPPGCLSLCTST